MDQVYQVLKGMSDLATVLYAISALKELASTDSKLYRETWTHIGTDAFKHFAHNPDAVFKSAAIFICTVIEIRRKELVRCGYLCALIIMSVMNVKLENFLLSALDM